MPDPTSSFPTVTVSAFEWDNLKREETLRALEARLSERFHRRFWVLLTVGMILSIGGVQTIAFMVISSRLMGPPAAYYAQAEPPAANPATARRADDQAARQMAALTDKFDKLNEKISSLETDNANLRLRLERTTTAAREPEPPRRPTATPSPPPAVVAPLTPPPPAVVATPSPSPPPAVTPFTPPPQTASLPPGDASKQTYRMNSEYEIRLVVFGKTEAAKIPPMQDYFQKLGYKVVAETAPDPTSPYPTRQDFVFISYRKGAKPEAQRIEQFVKREFNIQTVLAQYDVGDKLAGDIQIAFQESRGR